MSTKPTQVAELNAKQLAEVTALEQKLGVILIAYDTNSTTRQG